MSSINLKALRVKADLFQADGNKIMPLAPSRFLGIYPPKKCCALSSSDNHGPDQDGVGAPALV